MDELTTNAIAQMAAKARQAGRTLAFAPKSQRDALLNAIADSLADPETRSQLLEENRKDVEAGQAAVEAGTMSQALQRRLALNPAKLDALAEGLRQLATRADGLHQRLQHRRLDEGLVVEQRRVPLGVLGVIFESRPDAVPQIAGLCLRTGNAVILKGGKEAIHSNRALVSMIKDCLEKVGLPAEAVGQLEHRDDVAKMLECHRDIDLIIARGSGQFVEHIMSRSKIPVLGHAEGLCHMLLDDSAAADKAARIALDAKTSYPAACNAVETLLWTPKSADALQATLQSLSAAGVQLKGCANTLEAMSTKDIKIEAASDEDWSAEYSDLILSIKAVADLDEGLSHIETYGSKHTEVIITEDHEHAERFLREVDAACVFHNASGRFADGFRLGLGAEVGISTSKLHARGPVGVEGLLSTKWLLRGKGDASTDFAADKKSYLHDELPLVRDAYDLK